MAEKEVEVKTVQVEYQCDECGVGYMLSTGVQRMSLPPQYEHQCSHCNHLQSFRGVQYPYNKVVPV